MPRTQRASRRPAVAAMALFVVGVTSCGSEGTDSEVSAGDPGYAYQVIASVHESSADQLKPRTLAEALPNKDVVVRTDGGGDLVNSFSDVVVTGHITQVAPAEGIFYPSAASTTTGDEQDDQKVVGFDNPDAQERIALVTLQVDWSAGEKVGKTLQFRIGVPVDTDANKFLAGVRGIDEAVVLLKQFDEGRYQGDYYPIMDFAGLGSIDADGTLAFEGLGDDADAFVDGVSTVDELQVEASKPDARVTY